MKPYLFALAACLIFSAQLRAADNNVVRPGDDIDRVSKLMQNSGYAEDGLETAPPEGTSQKFWRVGKGTLCFLYSNQTKKVICIDYYLSDERPKRTRKEFEFQVQEFNPKTGEMKIIVPK